MGRIEKVTLYHCGFCVNNLAVMFRGMPWKSRRFPASAVLIQHKDLGNILYDTGYSELILGRGLEGQVNFFEKFILWLYRLLNPVFIREEDRIDRKLIQDGICTESVKTIILSHGHPDHVGGLSLFSEYELVVSAEVAREIKRTKTGRLVFSSQIPWINEKRIRQAAGEGMKGHFLCRYFDRVYDLFGDESVIGVMLSGHCKGQMGLWISDVKLFLAADACWGRDLVGATRRMRIVPRIIQEDFREYQYTLRRICRLKKDYPDIEIVFSHQAGKEQVYVGTD